MHPKSTTPRPRKNAAKPRTIRRGYVQLHQPEHPDAVGGYVWEHRIVAAAMLNRPLTAAEFVHHINHQRDDNRPENLQVMSRSEHRRLHWAETAQHEWSMKFAACKICGTVERPHHGRGLCGVCWNATVNGLRGYAMGERSPHARLTARAVVKIRERWANGETQQDLADEYGVTMSAVHLIVHRKNWKHLP